MNITQLLLSGGQYPSGFHSQDCVGVLGSKVSTELSTEVTRWLTIQNFYKVLKKGYEGDYKKGSRGFVLSKPAFQMSITASAYN